jgi:hypothetical protein
MASTKGVATLLTGEGSRPRPATARLCSKPRALPEQWRKYTLGFENAFTARGDPTSPNATTNGRKTTGYVGQAARPPRRGSSTAYGRFRTITLGAFGTKSDNPDG